VDTLLAGLWVSRRGCPHG